MRLVKNIALWIIVGFLAILALVTIPSFACIIALVIALLIAPIEKWQNILRKFIKGKIKVIAISVLAILMLATFPTTDPQNDTSLPIDVTSGVTTETTTAPTTEPTTQPATETTTPPTTETTAPPTTEATTPPTTETTTPPTTETTVPPTTEATAPPATEATTPPTTEATTPPTTEATTPPTTETTAPPSTEATAPPSTEATAPPTTEATTAPTENTKRDYILNNNTMKFHYPYCSSASEIKEENKAYFHGTRDELITRKYAPCGRCHP